MSSFASKSTSYPIYPIFQMEVPAGSLLSSSSETAVNTCCTNIENVAVGDAESVAETIRTRGWCLLRLRLEDEAEAALLRQWESIFSAAFEQGETEKKNGGQYRSEKKLPVGFRKDDEREFFESRIMTRGAEKRQVIEPCYSDVVDYEKLVRLIIALQQFVARGILHNLLEALGINPKAVINLTDIEDPVRENISGRNHLDAEVSNVSSSLLRICSYPPFCGDDNNSATATDRSDNMITFGSHTDTSCLTLGLVSSTPGLELYDRKEMRWLAGESIAQNEVELPTRRDIAMTVFVGEILQVLTKAHYRATVHRVRAPTHGTRISCPFIIRGKWGRVVNMRNGLNLDCEEGHEKQMEEVNLETFYDHPGGLKALRKHTPDLDGSDISLIHKILDLKRAKCRKKNEDNPNDWVLAAELEVIESSTRDEEY